MSDAAMFACAPLDSGLSFAAHCSARLRVNMDTVLIKIVKLSGLGALAAVNTYAFVLRTYEGKLFYRKVIFQSITVPWKLWGWAVSFVSC